eukprot:4692750-Amphidinium_carterae.1
MAQAGNGYAYFTGSNQRCGVIPLLLLMLIILCLATAPGYHHSQQRCHTKHPNALCNGASNTSIQIAKALNEYKTVELKCIRLDVLATRFLNPRMHIPCFLWASAVSVKALRLKGGWLSALVVDRDLSLMCPGTKLDVQSSPMVGQQLARRQHLHKEPVAIDLEINQRYAIVATALEERESSYMIRANTYVLFL